MKRYGHLFEQIVAFENLLLAAQKALLGKKDRRPARLAGASLEVCLRRPSLKENPPFLSSSPTASQKSGCLSCIPGGKQAEPRPNGLDRTP